MQFSKEEIIEILTEIGYKIHTEKDENPTRRTRMISALSESYYVIVDGEKFTPEEIFKKEIRKRLFNI